MNNEQTKTIKKKPICTQLHMLMSYIGFISGKAEKHRKNISYLFLLFQKGRIGRFTE